MANHCALGFGQRFADICLSAGDAIMKQVLTVDGLVFEATMRDYDSAHHVRAELMAGEVDGWTWEVIESAYKDLFLLRARDECGIIAGYLEI